MVARRARATLARRWLADFVQQAIAAGEVDGLAGVEWGPHLTAHCYEVQLQLEGWIVANGPGPAADPLERTAWLRDHADMIARQREAWERTGATWEDGKPEPWLRYVLVQNAVDNLPPGTLKSTIVMVCANAWIWLWAPRFSFGALSGIDANVGRDSRACRRLVRSAWYRETFQVAWTDHDAPLELEDEKPDITIDRESDAVDAWATSAGGKRMSRTMSRGLTGTHVDGIFLDDPDDADRVHNESERVRPQNRWTNVVENRVNDERRSIRRVMQQRVHLEDFTAYLLSFARWSPAKPKGWSWLCLPAEYGFGPADAPAVTPFGTRDWRADKGETLHPRLSAGVLADKREKLRRYEAQYNQNPGRELVGIFARRFARFFVIEGREGPARRRPDGCPQHAESPPLIVKLSEIRELTLSVDAANSVNPDPSAKVSAVGMTVAGCVAEKRLVLDDRTRVLGVSGTYTAIYEALGIWMIERVLVELKALGPGVVTEISLAIRRGWYLDPTTDQRIELLGPDGNRVRSVVEPWTPPPREDKVQRANAMVPSWERGEWYFLDGADWLYPRADPNNNKLLDEGLIGELCAFPASRRSDRVDTLSQFYARYRGATDVRDRWKAMGRLGRVGMRDR